MGNSNHISAASGNGQTDELHKILGWTKTRLDKFIVNCARTGQSNAEIEGRLFAVANRNVAYDGDMLAVISEYILGRPKLMRMMADAGASIDERATDIRVRSFEQTLDKREQLLGDTVDLGYEGYGRAVESLAKVADIEIRQARDTFAREDQKKKKESGDGGGDVIQMALPFVLQAPRPEDGEHNDS